MVFPEEVVVNAMYLKYNRFIGNHIFANDFMQNRISPESF